MLAEQRRGEILNAAEKLLATHGFDALRLRDVSEAAGVSIGLIQHHFATRDDLLLETMRVASERRAQQWRELARSAASPAAQVRALIEGAIGDHHRCVIWIETCAAATRHPELLGDVRSTQEAWHSAITEALTDAVQDGSVPADVSPGATAELLIRLIDGFMLDAAVGTASATDAEQRLALLKESAARILGGGWLSAQ
ncbi:TetR/AcrR family transcriptional regulator [Streptomyces hydrogenans]|uniref:TetR/AcrR family transcriptional regulator n=1 Tax=Streptomyces hydrogenans TaxID=1873719 RepID=UPI003645D864